MKCPVCGSYEQKSMSMRSAQFSEELDECVICGSSWSTSHGLAEVVVDAQLASFLECQTECVESDDYNWAA